MENSQDLSELLQTPKTSGILKKTKSFADRSSKENQDDDDDVWYTPPTGIPQTNSCPEIKTTNGTNRRSRRMLIKQEPVDLPDRSSELNQNTSITKPKGKIWSLVSSVVRMASFNSNSQMETSDDQSVLGAGIKRWASFSGILILCD